MEIHPLHEVTKSLRLKGSEAWIANLPAEKKVTVSLLWELLAFLSSSPVVSVLHTLAVG